MKTALRSTLSLLFGILLCMSVIPAVFAEENRVAIDLDNFPDWRFCAYIQETFDKDYDGFLSEEECAAVTEMNCSHKQLTDITGIGYFKNLKKLRCEYSSETIASIDLSGNPELEELSCVNAGVSNLNLTGNPKLIKLNCSMNYRRLTELDLSGNPLLEELDCSNCDLVSLDLSNNSELKRLICYGTELTELDLRANTKLEELSCGQCKMTELDVSANKQLKLISCGQDNLTSVKLCPHSALETLSCAYSKLTELDVSTQAELKELICYYNNLSALDVSANKKLESLICGNNYNLRELDLKANTKLRWLDSTWTGLYELDVSSCPALVELWETGNIENSDHGSTLWGGHQGDSSMLSCGSNVSILVIKGEESCGDNLSWTIYGSDALMIEGSGEMYDFSPQSSPWYRYHERIKAVGLPNELPRIGNNAFADFQALERTEDNRRDYYYYPDEQSVAFRFPSALESIGQNAFANCVSLKDLAFHPSLTNIESGAFSGCSGLRFVHFGGTEKQWNAISVGSENGSLMNAAIICSKHEPDFILPAFLTTIEAEAFEGGAFTFVKLPEGCSAIGWHAFADCPNLKYISIPDGCAIDDDAFAGVSGLMILGTSDGSVQTWAGEHGYSFIPVD